MILTLYLSIVVHLLVVPVFSVQAHIYIYTHTHTHTHTHTRPFILMTPSIVLKKK